MKLLLLTLALVGANATNPASCQGCNDGATLAGGTGCYCGSNEVFVAATEYCWVPSSHNAATTTANAVTGQGVNVAANRGYKLTKPLCPAADQDGTGAVAAECTCGLKMNAGSTDVTTGDIADGTKRCYKPSGTNVWKIDASADIATCTVTSGATASTPKCSCGSTGTLVAASEFCWVPTENNPAGIGYALGTVLCPSTDQDGTGAIAANCTCGLQSNGTPNAATGSQRCLKPSITVSGTTIATNQWVKNAADIVMCTAAQSAGGPTAPGNLCACGSNGEPVAGSGEFCWVPPLASNPNLFGYKLTVKLCPSGDQDGTDAIAANCTCGVQANGTPIAATGTQRCLKPSYTVGSTTTAPNTWVTNAADIIMCTTSQSAGAAAPGNLCACGSNGQAVAASGEFCWVPTDNNPTGFGYKLTSKLCPSSTPANDQDGAGAINANCTCGLNPSGVAQPITGTARCLKPSYTVGGTAFTGVGSGGVPASSWVTDAADLPMCTTAESAGTASPNAACACGSNGAKTTSSQFCYVPPAAVNPYGRGIQAATLLCTNTDGKTAHSAICTCGIGPTLGAGPQIATNEFCYIPSGSAVGAKLTAALCSPTDASASPTADCKCGTDAAGTGNGAAVTSSQFCFEGTTGVGQMSAAAVAPAATCVVSTASPAGVAAPGTFAALVAAVVVAVRM